MQGRVSFIVLYVQAANLEVAVDQSLHTLKGRKTQSDTGREMNGKDVMRRDCLTVTHIFVSIHTGQVQWCIAVVVLSVCVGFIVEQQQLQNRGNVSLSLM